MCCHRHTVPEVLNILSRPAAICYAHLDIELHQLPGLGRPALVELGLAAVADAGSLPVSARKQAAAGARRSASMGSQALQSSMRDPRLLNGAAESQVRGSQHAQRSRCLRSSRCLQTQHPALPLCAQCRHACYISAL